MEDRKTISAFYEQDHDRLDELFSTFQMLKRSDAAQAKHTFKEFKVGLQRHIVWEEDLLFPLWEEKTGMREGGPTFAMREEHRRIGALLDSLHEKVANENPDSHDDEQALLTLLGTHNLKEERVLYPGIDQVTTEQEREQVFRNMAELPEARYRVCCGVENR